MTQPKKERLISVEEFLKLDELSDGRREYLDGQLCPIAGTSRRHNKIVMNTSACIRDHLRGSHCRAYTQILVHIEEANVFYYPDLLVTCDGYDDDSRQTSAPVLIVEVLSPSTAGTDKREKKRNYQRLASLSEYVLIHQKRQQIDLFRKDEESDWVLTSYGCDDTLSLESLPNGLLHILVSNIYKDTDAPRVNIVSEEARQYMLLTIEDEWDY